MRHQMPEPDMSPLFPRWTAFWKRAVRFLLPLVVPTGAIAFFSLWLAGVYAAVWAAYQFGRVCRAGLAADRKAQLSAGSPPTDEEWDELTRRILEGD